MASGASSTSRGGTVSGPRLNGRILPGGADWQIIRADGAADIEARYTIETERRRAHDLVNSEGLRHGPARRDRETRPRRAGRSFALLFPHRDAVRDAAHPSLRWLNTILALARGERRARAVRLEVYEVL